MRLALILVNWVMTSHDDDMTEEEWGASDDEDGRTGYQYREDLRWRNH